MIVMKTGVKFHNMDENICKAVYICDDVYQRFAADGVVITSARDGTHMQNSLHYQGKAVDLRIWTVPTHQHNLLVAAIKDSVGPDFDVVLEKDHIHLEYDPKNV